MKLKERNINTIGMLNYNNKIHKPFTRKEKEIKVEIALTKARIEMKECLKIEKDYSDNPFVIKQMNYIRKRKRFFDF